MVFKLILATLVLCTVTIEVKSVSDSKNRDGCTTETHEHTRVKRAKYYSSPPLRLYRKPPLTYPIKGLFSYTPPPNYMMDEDEPQYPGLPTNHKPYKFNKASNDDLGDADINNIVNYLSKQNLDKIIETAKDKYSNKYSNDLPIEIDYKPIAKSPNNFKMYNQEIETQGTNNKLFLNNPYINDVNNEYRAYKLVYNDPNYMDTQAKIVNKPQYYKTYTDTTFNSEESKLNKQVTTINANIQLESNDKEYEEILPKPLNLREDDYDLSNTNNVPVTVKRGSYKVEDFGDLPLMNYNSKKTNLNSYSVPHYTVTSFKGQTSSLSSAASSISSPPIEPAPPATVAKEQSEAHLKAIKIWTHRSKGTAYTLHDDGTLSLERPNRPKIKYIN